MWCLKQCSCCFITRGLLEPALLAWLFICKFVFICKYDLMFNCKPLKQDFNTRTVNGHHISCLIDTKYWNLYRTSHTLFLQSNNSLCLLVSEQKIFKISTNQKQELPMGPCFLFNWDEMRRFYRGPSIDASCKFHFICPSGFWGEDF